MISTIAVIALGGAIGAVARYGVSSLTPQILGSEFPWATLIINVAGSFLMGVAFVKFTQINIVSQEMKMFLTVGILGAFTTFSTFSLDALILWERGEIVPAFAYMMSSVILSITALFIGVWITRVIL